MKKSLLYLLVLLSFNASAQPVRTPVSFGYTSLAAYSNRFHSAFSFAANQGALAATQRFSAGVYSERRFLLTALSTYSAAAVLPTASGNFGLRGDYTGQSAYNESSLGLAYGRNVGTKAAVGVQFNYYNVKAASYGTASTINFDVAALFHLAPNLNAGLQAHNPVGSGWGKDDLEKLPAMYAAGLGYDASEQFYIGATIEKVENNPVSVNAGLHYQPAEKLSVRLGLHSATSAYWFGVGTQLKNFRFDVTASLHPYLGLTPGLLLLYTPKE